MIFSNTIIKDIGGLNARIGTIYIGLVYFLASCVSIYTVRNYGRRFLLLVGHSGIAICHCTIGVLAIYDVNYGVLGGLLVFLFFYFGMCFVS